MSSMLLPIERNVWSADMAAILVRMLVIVVLPLEWLTKKGHSGLSGNGAQHHAC